MHTLRVGIAVFLALGAAVLAGAQGPYGRQSDLQPEAEQLLALANGARAAAGARPLAWDPSLTLAAKQHCLRMAAEGPIAHRYGGEADLSMRAAQAGARFSLIEENVAIGPSPAAIHDEWMNSSGHRANLLNAKVDRVGIAVVASRGVLYAVADYAQAVKVRTTAEVEDAVGSLLRARGLIVVPETMEARAYCAHSRELNGILGNNQPTFAMEWQNSDPTQLPKSLEERLTPGLRKAAVGSCAPQDVEGAFTVYRVAVLLY